MKINRNEKKAEITAVSGDVRRYQKSPSNFDAACRAAHHYARRDGETMAVVPGNSYGSRVFHIARCGDDLRKYTVVSCTITGAVVDSDGSVFMACLS